MNADLENLIEALNELHRLSFRIEYKNGCKKLVAEINKLVEKYKKKIHKLLNRRNYGSNKID